MPIQVDQGDFETLRQKSTDRALAGSTRSDQSNLLGVTHVTRMIFPPEVAKGLLKRELESEATAASLRTDPPPTPLRWYDLERRRVASRSHRI